MRSVHSSFTFRFERDGANYRWFPAMGGGALYDVGCYTISIARLVLGAEPVSVFAAARVDPATGIDMTTSALLEFPGGRFAHCEASFESHFQSRLLVVGSEGTLRLDRAFSAKDFDATVEIVRGDAKEAVRIPKADMFLLMIEHFGDAVLGRAPPSLSRGRRLAQHARDRRLLRVPPDPRARRHPLTLRSKRRSVMRSAKAAAFVMALVLFAACSHYTSKPQMTYYHGQNVPEGYITILHASPGEITFQIRIEFAPKQMYHLILDGNEPVAQGWFSTLRAGGQSYTVTLKPAEGAAFEPGKTYRLCIGVQNPQAVQMSSSNYECKVDHTFVFVVTS